MNAKQRAQELFERHYGALPEGVAAAPGRVNLIGDHTDYVGGFVFPAALRLNTAIAYRRSAESNRVCAVSEALADKVDFGLRQEGVSGWGGYLAGIAWALLEAGFELSGLELAVASDVPTASGLSSSAALEVAMARAWRTVDELELDDVNLAKLCQRAENAYVGVPSGILDQFASSVPAVGQAIILDCRSLDYQVIAIPADWTFVIVDSGASRQLAGSAYEQRVKECAEVARQLHLRALRDLQAEQLLKLDGDLLKRARHVYGENQRVLEAASAMKAADIVAFGRLMSASHASLRDNYEVSSPTLDRLVEAALAFEGCYGARLTGAGFGGSTVQLLKRGSEDAFGAYLEERVPSARLVARI